MNAGWSALLDAGCTVEALGPDQILVACPEVSKRARTMRVVTQADPLSPSHVRRLWKRWSDEPLLLRAPSASPAALAAAVRVGWSVLTDTGQGHLAFDRSVKTLGVDGDDVRVLKRPRGRPGYSRFTVVRHLLREPASTQAQIAQATLVVQPRVSKVLHELAGEGLLVPPAKRGDPWRAADWDALADWWLTSYPGPGGVVTSWYGLASPRDQATEVQQRLSELGARTAISGDVAADEIAPWRRPTSTIVYVAMLPRAAKSMSAELAHVGLTLAHDETEATLLLVMPVDEGLWPVDAGVGGLSLAEPMQLLWDVSRSSEPGADQAADKLRAVLRDRAR